MRIGIDVTPLPERPVGAGNYILHLARALAELECEHEFIIIAQHSGRRLIEQQPLPRLAWSLQPDRSPARRLAWEQFGLPVLAGRLKLDLLHSLHYTRPLWLPCPSVVTFHDLTFFLFPELHTRAKRLFFPPVMRFSARRARALAAVSESTRRDAVRILGIDPGRIFTTPLGLSSAFRPIDDRAALEACRARYNLPERFLLNVGLVEPRKNLPLLLQAYAGLPRPAAPPLVVVGRMGWGYEAVLRQVEQLGLQQQVHFAGYVPAEDLPLVYNLAQVFVYPSLYEGFGLPPVEAMACGTPVVTTGISAMLDNVGPAGLLTPPGDAPALAQAMAALLAQPELRQELRERGLRRAAEFTWQRTALETLKIYQTVLDSRPGRAADRG